MYVCYIGLPPGRDTIRTKIPFKEQIFSWEKFIIFALFVVGISSTVNPHRLEKYVLKRHTDQIITELSPDAWFLEIYQTILTVLSSLSVALMSFFIIALIAFTIVRGLELKKPNQQFT